MSRKPKPKKKLKGGKGKAASGTNATASDKPSLFFDAGNTTKDSAYLGRIVRATLLDLGHPRHHGIKMQAHHLISATGMHLSRLGPKIKKFGYDINELENLAFLPCTLQGACHLGVQLHRGNHTAVIEDERYDDDEHPQNYHRMVASAILNLKLGLTKECPGYMGGAQEIAARHKVKNELDELSAKILRLIAVSPRQAPLTKLALSFKSGNPVGCGGVDSTTTHRENRNCPVDRNHQQKQGPGQRVEKITYQTQGTYKLKVGK